MRRCGADAEGCAREKTRKREREKHTERERETDRESMREREREGGREGGRERGREGGRNWGREGATEEEGVRRIKRERERPPTNRLKLELAHPPRCRGAVGR